MQEQQIWHATLERLRMSIDPAVFSLWFQETAALSWQEGMFVIGVPTTFTNGQTEGQITRLKLLKRQGYGRANFQTLRKRMLYRAS